MAETPGDAPAGSVAASPGEVVQPPAGSVAASPGEVAQPPAGGVAEASDGVVTIFRNDGAPWWNPALRFAHGEGSGELLPLDQSTSFKLTARVKIPEFAHAVDVRVKARVVQRDAALWVRLAAPLNIPRVDRRTRHFQEIRAGGDRVRDALRVAIVAFDHDLGRAWRRHARVARF